VDIEPGRRVIRREVRRTERVRREVTLRLSATRAIRLGAKLVFRGLVAAVRGRPVQLSLRSDSTRPPVVQVEPDEAAEASLDPASPPGDG
jgi:hypothetical protein